MADLASHAAALHVAAASCVSTEILPRLLILYRTERVSTYYYGFGSVSRGNETLEQNISGLVQIHSIHFNSLARLSCLATNYLDLN
jgi:hypothetical protein